MVKRDVLEIRKLFAPDKCAISKVCGCYVDGDGNKVSTFSQQFLTLPEEETFKYYEIFKKTLSGSIGKNLVTMPFPTDQEFDGGTQNVLYKLRKSGLTDDKLLDSFYDNIIANYDYTGNYVILLIHDTYDVPGKSSDGLTMNDASEEVYEYILCSICHVNLSKPGLSYFDSDNVFHNRVRDWVVDKPDIGFLFPAFIERSTDIHNVLYYTSKPESLHDDFLQNVLGTSVPVTAGNQKDSFQQIITETLGDECTYDTIKAINENLNELVETRKDAAEPLTLCKNTIKSLLSESGVSDSKIKKIDEVYANVTAPDKETETFRDINPVIYANNIADTKTFEVKTPDVTIKVNPDRTDLVETKIVDGCKCIVVRISEGVEVNGIPVK